MNQMAEATRAPGSAGGGPETSNLTCSLVRQAGSLFQGTVGSDPFSDLHRISRLTEVSVDDLNWVEMTTFREETTDGRL